MENYEVMNNVNEGMEVVEELTKIAEADLLPTEISADDILKQTGKDALITTGLIAAGLAATYVGFKYVVPKVKGLIKEAKAKKEQAEFEAELTSVNNEDEE